MGWFDSINPWKRDDPLSELDPELRKYLQSQAPSSYKTAQETNSSSTETQTYREQLGLKHNDPEAQHKKRGTGTGDPASATTLASLISSTDAVPASEDESTSSTRPLPSHSLYQDGRYAHLWSTYRPQTEIEDAGKSDQERLLDIVHGYKERQAQVSRAALENCSEAQWAVHECFRSGSWSALSTMCKAENRELSRCIMMQSRFLRALGYLSMYERSTDESEQIQMHADVLYQRMLEEERQGKEIKAEGKDTSKQSISEAVAAAAGVGGAITSSQTQMSTTSKAATTVTSFLPPNQPSRITFDSLPEHIRTELASSKKFAGLSGDALELAKREIEQDLSFHADVVERLDERYRIDRKERLARLEAGEERVSDKVKKWFDFRKYNDEKKADEVTEKSKKV